MIKLDDLVDTYNACADALDESKTCETCKFNGFKPDEPPCNNCYNIMLNLPVNPTEWKPK